MCVWARGFFRIAAVVHMRAMQALYAGEFFLRFCCRLRSAKNGALAMQEEVQGAEVLESMGAL